MLKKIEAIIREDKVNDVRDALNEIGIVGMNMFEVRGHGRQGGIQLVGRAGTYQVNMLPKIQINIVLNERNLDAAAGSDSQIGLYGRDGRRHYFCYTCGGCHSRPHARAGTGCNDVSGRY